MPMRIVGLTSGMDIDKIVSDLMKAERAPQIALKQKKDLLNYKTSLYREVNTKISALREALNSIRFSSGLTGLKATASNTDISVISNSSSSKSSYTMKVLELASPAVTSGTEGVSTFGLEGGSYSSSAIVKGVNDKLVMTVDNQAKVITLKEGNFTIDEMKENLQKDIDAQFGANRVSVVVNGDKLSLEPKTSSTNKPQISVNEYNGGLAALGFSEGQSYRLNLRMTMDQVAQSGKLDNSQALSTSGEFIVNGISIKYDETDTLQSIMNKVNSSQAGATMNYDSVNNKFVFKNRATGASSNLSIENVSGNLLEMLKVPTGTNSGTDSKVIIDGEEKTFPTNSINFDGMTIQLNKASAEDVTINITGDTDAVVEKIKKFVSVYNDLMELVNTQLAEKRDRNFNPLTDEEKAAMSETDIANWEKKVKEGLLSDSSILRNVKSSLRGLLSKEVAGIVDEFNTLSEVGITTVPYVRGVSKDAGKITIDETKLKNAIESNPDAVKALFTNNPGFESQEGIAVTMYNKVNDLMNTVMKQAGRLGGLSNDVSTTLGKQIYDLETKISRMEILLNKKEDNYYKRFSLMEQAIQKGNAQLSWLSQQLG